MCTYPPHIFILFVSNPYTCIDKYQKEVIIEKGIFFTFLEIFLLLSCAAGVKPKEGRTARVPYPRNSLINYGQYWGVGEEKEKKVF